MRWSERMKLTFETFKRVALPLYGWYFIFAFAILVIIIAGLLPIILPIMNMGGSPFSSPFPGSNPSPPPFPNPNPPMPPGSSANGLSPFSDFLGPYISSPYLTHAPYVVLFIILIVLFSWVGSSAYLAGMFNLSKKSLHENVRFRDFRFSGISRVLGWYGILTLVSFLIIIVGVVGLAALRGTSYMLPLFGGLYVLLMVSLGIFFLPWFSTSVFYMLNHRELGFSRSLNGSWNFYRRNMGSLWLLLATVVGIEILLSVINQSSPTLGFFVGLLAAPYTAILPIVWVLSLEDEENQQTLAWNFPSAFSETTSQTTPENSPQTSPQPFTSEAINKSPDESTAEESSLDDNSSQSPSDIGTNTASDSDLKLSLNLNPSSNPDLNSTSTPTSASTSTPSSLTLPQESAPSSPSITSPATAPTSESPPAPVNYCPTCGQKTRPGARYCSQCGTQL